MTSHAYAGGDGAMSEHAMKYLAMFKDSLVAARPREVTAEWDKPFLLFTDASFSPGDES